MEQALLAKAVGFNYAEQEVLTKKEVFYENGKKSREVSEPVVLDVNRFKAAEYNAQVFWLINRKPELWKDKKDIKPPASEEELVRIIDDIVSVSGDDEKNESDEDN